MKKRLSLLLAIMLLVSIVLPSNVYARTSVTDPVPVGKAYTWTETYKDNYNQIKAKFSFKINSVKNISFKKAQELSSTKCDDTYDYKLVNCTWYVKVMKFKQLNGSAYMFLNSVCPYIDGSYDKDGQWTSAGIHGDDSPSSLYNLYYDKVGLNRVLPGKTATVKVTGNLVMGVEKNKINYLAMHKYHNSKEMLFFSYEK